MSSNRSSLTISACPNARLSLGRSARVAGTLCTDRMNTDPNVVVECVP